MSALLMAAIILAVVSVIFEIKLMRTIPILSKLTQRFSAFGIIMSMFLSVMMGIIFGAAGLTVMIAGVMSTVLTQPYHTWENKRSKMSEEQRSKFSDTVNDYRATYRPVFKTIKWTLIILTSPIWIPVKIRNWYVRNSKPRQHAATA